MPTRERRELGTVDRECEVCGHSGLTVLRSRAVRRGADKANPFFRAQRKTYALCPECRTRRALPGWTAAAPERRRWLTVLGWVAAALLGLVVLVQVVVLAVLLSPVSLPLAVGVVVAVALLVALLIWIARRPVRS